MASGRFYIQAITACTVAALAAPADAAGEARQQVDIRAGPLPAALREFARETGAELLFDEKLVSGISARAVRGKYSRREALSKLLTGTGIGFRSTGGSLVLFRLSPGPISVGTNKAATDEADEDLPIPEILVTGRRSQNADIRRTESDIQPYKVSTRREVERAHRSNIEEFTRARVPANAQARTLAQDASGADIGNVRSAIDLRGLGSRRTLVLVDGRRLPRPIGSQNEFDQGDVNGIPLSAIERIETLTGTAGGIHGPGALGGVINVVLRRDFSGADLHVTSGITSRGDAKRLQVEGRAGISVNGGRTKLMVLGSHQVSQPLLTGDRDFGRRAREIQYANNPEGYLDGRSASNAIVVYSADGSNLNLDAEFGGASLGSSYSYLPLDFAGSRSEALALLGRNAGKLDFSLADDPNGARRSIVSAATVTSALATFRHRASENIELFVEGLAYRNMGSFFRGSVGVPTTTNRNAPTNPFDQRVLFVFPLPTSAQERRVTSDTARVTAGLIVDLPADWSGSADYTLGLSRGRAIWEGLNAGSRFRNAVRLGTAVGDLPAIDPLGGWTKLVSATSLYLEKWDVRRDVRNDFKEASLRLAGPLVRSRAGPVVLSVLAQHRTEDVPGPRQSLTSGGDIISAVLPARKQEVSSAYAELRAPLLSRDVALLGGLEVQLAARYDSATTSVFSFASATQGLERQFRAVRQGLNYTLGAKFYPMPNVMFRASVATGEQYPTITQLTALRRLVTPGESLIQGTPDPQRGSQQIGGGAPVLFLSGGDPDLRSERAVTVTAGAVLNPAGVSGPRVSIDYSRIDRRGEIVRFPLSPAVLLARENDFEGRVVRSPLSPADAQLGYTAGAVTAVDIRSANEGRTIAEAVDVEFDWTMPFSGGSEIQLYGGATWQPQLRMRSGKDQPWRERIGYFDGPSAWRGNIGAEWTRGPLSLDLNLQVFSSYRVSYANPDDVEGLQLDNAVVLSYQGKDRVGSEAYLDLGARRRFQLRGRAGPLDSVEARLGIQNVLDKRPATIASPFTVPYSTYGDARRRRFELTLSSRF